MWVAVTEILQGPILEVDVFTAQIIRSVAVRSFDVQKNTG